MSVVDLISRLVNPFWVKYEKQMKKLLDIRLGRLKFDLEETISRGGSPQGRGIPAAGTQAALRDPGHRWKYLQIGLTDLCNLLCLHCSRIPKEPDLKGTLGLTAFSHYLSCFSPEWFTELEVSDWGEPTIIPGLINYLYLAKRNGWDNVGFVTNGTSRDKGLFEEIVSERLLGNLRVSTEAASPELYEKIRGSSFKRFQEFMTMIRDYKQTWGSDLKVTLCVTCMKENLHELPDIVRMAADMEVNNILMAHLNPMSHRTDTPEKLCRSEQHLDSLDRAEVLSVFEKVFTARDSTGIDIALPEAFPEISGSSPASSKDDDTPPNEYRCTEPLIRVQVGYAGDIYPCCQMGQRYSVGNINNLDMHSLWRNLKYKRLLDGLRINGDPIDACRNCNVLAGKNF